MLRIITAALLFFALASDLKAQSPVPPNNAANSIAIELDPAPFIFGGYSFSVKYSPQGAEHFSIMASIYGSDLPNALMSKSNADLGFKDVTIETSYAVFADYFFSSDRSGFHVGPSLFLYSKSVGREGSTDRVRFSSLFPNVRVGYLYKPFDSFGLYVNPWVNVGKEFIQADKPELAGKEFTANSIAYITAIHLGYQFTF